MKRNRNRAGWLKMAAAGAFILSVGIAAAFGMEAWLPAYDHKVLPLSKELLAAAPGNDPAGSELTLYPWNLYDKTAMSAVTDTDQALLDESIQTLLELLNARRDGRTADSGPASSDLVRLRAAFEKREAGAETLYFMKDQTMVIAGENSLISCAVGSTGGILYVHCREENAPHGDEPVGEAALNKAVARVRERLSTLGKAEYIKTPTQFKKYVPIGAASIIDLFSLSDFRDADVVATDKDILLVCTAAKENAQLVLILDPLSLELRGFSMQR